MRYLLAFAALTLLLGAEARAQFSFQNGNVVVSRVGTGTGALSSAATAVFLEERSGVDGSVVQTISLATSGANRLTMSGTATSEGKIKYYNGYLAVAGYDADAGATGPGSGGSIATSLSATVNRKVALYSNGGSVSYTSLSDAYSASNIRAAISDGTNIWTAGTASNTTGGPGVRHTTVGSTTSTQLSTTVTNVRTVNIFDGQLFASHASGSNGRIMSVGTGLPTTSGQSMVGLTGVPNADPSGYDFFFADLDASISGADTMFRTVGNNVEQFVFDGTTWLTKGTIAIGAETFGLSGIQNGSSVEFFVNTASALRKYTLTSAWGSGFTANQNWNVAAGANTAFRGNAAISAVPEPTAAGLLALTGV
ncbi:MAG: hypothetical protein ACK6A8_12970, partial [Planctomycetota bacterium]